MTVIDNFASSPIRIEIQRLDELIRAARKLGLDRLGSAQDDEEVWCRTDASQRVANPSSNLPVGVSGHWAADTLVKRDKTMRNLGRALWTSIVAKDWAAARVCGTCMIYPHTFTTTQPTPYSDGSSLTEDDGLVWSITSAVSFHTFKYFNVCIEAQSKGETINYDQISELDAELMLELQRRPDWLRAEEYCSKWDSQPRLRHRAFHISFTLWHRLFSLVSQMIEMRLRQL